MAVKKVAVTLSKELYEMVKRARAVENRSRSEVIQEALDAAQADPGSLTDRVDVRESF